MRTFLVLISSDLFPLSICLAKHFIQGGGSQCVEETSREQQSPLFLHHLLCSVLISAQTETAREVKCGPRYG